MARRYALTLPERAEGVRFCDTPNRDGYDGELEFSAPDAEVGKTLQSIGLALKDLRSPTENRVKRYQSERASGWNLESGKKYLMGRSSAEWDGECLIDYIVFVEQLERSRMKVYLAMGCQS
ncbi:hypothetical protein [Streptomyces sp. NPDC101166]|uniref:hypothetical protein n=1 Tax=Streptomyces sp. NPDC101166 TaxID=3366120 RepID=UPI0037F98419